MVEAGLGAGADAGLEPFVGAIAEGVGRRVGVHVVVRRELGLDGGQRDIAAEAQHQALDDPRDIRLGIQHRKIAVVDGVVLERLVAREASRGGVAIILAIDRADPKAPADMVGLHRVGARSM